MTFKMSKDESEILTLAFKLREVVRGCDPEVVDAAIAVCVSLNTFDQNKNHLHPSHSMAIEFAKGLEDAALQFGAKMGIPPPPGFVKEEPPAPRVGPLSPDEIKALNEEDEPNDAK